MSKEQRAKIDAMLRQAGPQGPRSIEQRRAGFRVMRARAIVPTAIRTAPATLASRPVLLVEAEPRERARPGTILYFHGGDYVVGSPETALCVTGDLVAKTGAALAQPRRLQERMSSDTPLRQLEEQANGGTCGPLPGITGFLGECPVVEVHRVLGGDDDADTESATSPSGRKR
jgi:hypothetical protein